MTIDLFPPRDENQGNEKSEPPVYSVGELTRLIKNVLDDFPTLHVSGEISNINRHGSGHVYFTLKDEQAQIKAVLWKSQARDIRFPLEDGMKVIVRGRLALYERGGYYQIVVADLQPEGLGELQLAFERLKAKLFSEGLFDPAHKKPLPRIPTTVGIVTSPTGAAIRDMVSVIQRRLPMTRIILAPVRVQGEGAAAEIVSAIKNFEASGLVDVLIVGRGGGSMEDLWAFNEEAVAKAIYDCRIPVISAVGHEIDFTIADLVADHRAATPSVAGEEVVPHRDDLAGHVNRLADTAYRAIRERLDQHRKHLAQYDRAYAFRQPENIIAQYRQRSDELERRMTLCVTHGLALHQSRLSSVEKQLQTLDPAGTLKRGYSIVRQEQRIVQRISAFKPGDPVELEFFDGKTFIDGGKKN